MNQPREKTSEELELQLRELKAELENLSPAGRAEKEKEIKRIEKLLRPSEPMSSAAKTIIGGIAMAALAAALIINKKDDATPVQSSKATADMQAAAGPGRLPEPFPEFDQIQLDQHLLKKVSNFAQQGAEFPTPEGGKLTADLFIDNEKSINQYTEIYKSLLAAGGPLQIIYFNMSFQVRLNTLALHTQIWQLEKDKWQKKKPKNSQTR